MSNLFVSATSTGTLPSPDRVGTGPTSAGAELRHAGSTKTAPARPPATDPLAATASVLVRDEAARAGVGLGLAALYGLALGARTGGVSFLRHGVGVPAALAVSLGIGVPALYIGLALLDAPVDLARAFRAASRATFTTGLVLAGLAPRRAPLRGLERAASSGGAGGIGQPARGLRPRPCLRLPGPFRGMGGRIEPPAGRGHLRVRVVRRVRGHRGPARWMGSTPASRSPVMSATATATAAVVAPANPATIDETAPVGATLNSLLRTPSAIAGLCYDACHVRTIALSSLLAIVVGAGVFGGVIGSYRGGTQIVYAAVKLPLGLLLTLALSAPGLHGLAAGFGHFVPPRAALALALASAGRAALVLLALAPAVWLLFDLGASYHLAALGAAVADSVAGLAGLSVIVAGLGKGRGRMLTTLSFAVLFFAVGGQTSWMLRPYLVRPRTLNVPFLRAREGSFVDSNLAADKLGTRRLLHGHYGWTRGGPVRLPLRGSLGFAIGLTDVGILYLVVGFACAVAIYRATPEIGLRALALSALAVPLWPLWAPIALTTAKAPEPFPGQHARKGVGPLFPTVERATRIEAALREGVEACAGTAFEPLLTREAADRHLPRGTARRLSSRGDRAVA